MAKIIARGALVKKKITSSERHELEAFLFAYPLEHWTTSTMFNNYEVYGKSLCKVCDKWVNVNSKTKHVESHTQRWIQAVEERRQENEKKRIAAIKRSRIARKNNNAA